MAGANPMTSPQERLRGVLQLLFATIDLLPGRRLRATADRVLVMLVEQPDERTSTAGLVLLNQAKQPVMVSVVLDIGPTAREQHPELGAGTFIVCDDHAGLDVWRHGVLFRFIKARDVLGVAEFVETDPDDVCAACGHVRAAQPELVG